MKNDQAASASLSQAVGRSEERHDVVGPVTLRGFAALLDLSPDEARLDEGLPPLWHWACSRTGCGQLRSEMTVIRGEAAFCPR